MEIVVKGRHLSQDVGEAFKSHCADKLARLDRLDPRLIRLDVELSHEPNPRMADRSQRVEITVRTRGPVVRAEAAAHDCYAAFERALDKLEHRLRRAQSRRTASHSHSHHAHVPEAPADPMLPPPLDDLAPPPAAEAAPEPVLDDAGNPLVEVGKGLVVREKVHHTCGMTLEDALHAMELVGHDFYLYWDSSVGRPSVVYRRRGYDYGVLRLDLEGDASAAAALLPGMAALNGAAHANGHARMTASL